MAFQFRELDVFISHLFLHTFHKLHRLVSLFRRYRFVFFRLFSAGSKHGMPFVKFD